MPLLNDQVRDELKTIADAIKSVENLSRDIPEVEDLHNTLFVDIRAWKITLRKRLRNVLNAIDAGTPQLQGIPDLREAIITARQLLGPPGGPPGVTDDHPDP